MEAKVNGVACELLDSVGRLIVSPNAMSVEGQTNTPVDLRENETLDAFLRRHVEGISSEGWAVAVNGYEVNSEDWAVTYPSVGQVIAVRARVGKAALQLVAIAALTYFTFGFGTVAAGAGYVAGAIGTVGAMGVYIAGSILINKVLGPKVPKPGVVDQGTTQFSLRDQRNQPRQYEPLPIVWGVVRVTPDLASKSYTTYEGNEQYMQMILLAGINVQNMDNLSIGDTALSQYDGVELYYDHVPAQEQKSIPIFTNADSIAGADLVNGDTAGIVRTTSVDTLTFQVDIEGQLYDIDNKGNTKTNSVSLKIESAVTGTDVWTTNVNTTLSNASTALVRRTYTVSVPKGQYDVRVSMGTPTWNEGGNADACKFAFQTLRSIQEDNADYSRFGRLGARIKASGQLTGSLDTIQADMTAKPMPVWTPTGWQTATTRENGLSNPGAVMLQALRGVYSDDGELLWGAGYPDEMIDIESYKSFMLYCTAKGFTYDKWVTAGVTIGDFLDEVALAGLAEFSYVDGSRPSVVFVAADQPLSGVIGMANMAKGSFGVDYTLSNAADGIEYKYLDRNRNWELQTLRVAAPGKTTMLNPAQLTGEGVTTEAQAAMLARYHLAQSLYQYKTISYGSDLESLDYRRLSIVSLSHDMTQWGVSGRLLAISKDSNGIATVNLDMDVPPHATPYIGFRIHGERDYRVFEVSAVTEATDTITLAEPWPEDLPFPGEDGGMIYDVLWCYDFKETPGYRVRVVDMESEEEMVGAKVTCVPESPEFWTYVETGEYTPPPVQQVRPRDVAVISNLKVTEQTNIQGDTEWYEFTATWDIEGDYDHAQVWAGIDGSELRMVDGNAIGASSTFRIDTKGSWLIRVIPFNSRGQAGLAQALLYITVGVDLPPRNPSEFYVQLVEGSLRRFAWNYTQKPAALAGVQIRYVPGDVPLSVTDWDSMTPIGQPDDIYSGAFITTKPDAGTYSFGLRAVNTSGIMAEGVVRTVATLDNVFDNVLQPDLTPPPTPTGFEVATAFANAMLSTDATNYTEGHGPDKTIFYVATISEASPNPTFADATIAAEIAGTIGSAPVRLGAKYRWWAKWRSKDGVLSALPTAHIDTQVGLVGGSDLADDIITAGKLADGSVSASKLAEGAVGATKFANGIEPVTVVDELPTNLLTSAVAFNGKLYRWNGTEYTAAVGASEITGQLVSDQIANGVITAAKFADGLEPVTVVSALPGVFLSSAVSYDGNLYRWDGTKYTKSVPAADVTGQLVADQLADGVVGATKFASGIEPITLYTGAVPTTKSTSTISVDGKLYRWDGAKYIKDVVAADIVGQITGLQLADNAVTANKIAAGIIDATKFASGNEPVTIVSGAVPTVKTTTVISANGVLYRWDGTKYVKSVAAVDIEGQITGSQIAASAIDATKLASSIEPVTIVSTLPATKSTALVSLNGTMYRWDGTKYTKEVPAVDITGQIAGTQIAAGAVTAAKIAANAVTAGKIAADAVTAGTVAAGAINTRELAANSVTTTKLVVKGQGGVINDDPALDDVVNTWITGVGVDVQSYAAESASTSKYFRAAASGAGQVAYSRRHVSIDPNKTYFLSASLYAAAGNNRRVYIFIQFYDAYGAWLTTSWGATYSGYAYGGFPAIGKWTRYGDQIGAGASKKIPTAARTAQIGVLFQDAEGTSSVMQGAGDIRLELANDASLIVDGSIIATKVAANAITADKIAANAVTSESIAANAITTAKLAAGAVTTDVLAAGSVTASKLVIADYSTLVPDSDYTEPAMWRHSGSGSHRIIQEATGNAGTLSRNVLQLFRGTDNWSGVISKTFGVTPGKKYVLRMLVWHPASARILSRISFLKSSDLTESRYVDTDTTYASGWREMVVNAVPAGTEGIISVQVWLDANSAADFVLLGKIRVQEATESSLIVDGSITADKIETNAVTAVKIAANAVTADKIAANSVSSDKLTANSVIAGKIAADAITSGTIAAGAISSREIAAGSITTTKLVVSSQGTSLTDDPALEDPLNAWIISGGIDVEDFAAGTASTSRYFAAKTFGTGGQVAYTRRLVSIDPNKTYFLSASLFAAAGNNRFMFILAQFYDANKAFVGTSWGGSFSGYVFGSTPITGSWNRYGAQIGAGTARPIPENVRYVQVGVIMQYAPTGNSNVLQGAGDIRLERANDSTLIVDGSITTAKLVAGSITSDKVAANAITTAAIAANAITAAKIATGTITADQIATDSITASRLILSDTTTLIRDPEYRDARLWGSTLGTLSLTYEPSGYAGTMSQLVARLDRGTNPYEWHSVYSAQFGVTPNKRYAIRTYIYTPTACTVILRAVLIESPSGTERIFETYHSKPAGWYLAETAGNVNLETKASVFIFLNKQSSYMLVGKIKFQEAMSSALIVDGAVTAAKIDALAVTSDKLAANSVIAGKIASNAVTADTIAANSITTAKVAAGAINTAQLAAGSITASKLVLTDAGTLIRDPEYQDISMWSRMLGSIGIQTDTSELAGTLSRNVLKITRGTDPYDWHGVRSAAFSVKPSTKYAVTGSVYVPAPCNVIFRMTYTSQQTGNSSYFEINKAYAAGWQLIEITGITAADANSGGVEVWLNKGSSTLLVGKLTVREAIGSSLIVDGAITATKLAANSIVAGTAAIQNGAIVNAMIADATIDSAKIASLSATKITAGYMQVGSYIASNNFAWGSAGFIVEANGNSEFNNITARGSIYSSNGNIGGVRINGNGLNTGSYSGYVWPTNGGTGFHLGPSGLLFGNVSTGRYIEIQQGGNMFAPGFRLQDGNAYFSGQLNIQSAASGARLVINNSQVLVYDGNNTLRVRLGIW